MRIVGYAVGRAILVPSVGWRKEWFCPDNGKWIADALRKRVVFDDFETAERVARENDLDPGAVFACTPDALPGDWDYDIGTEKQTKARSGPAPGPGARDYS